MSSVEVTTVTLSEKGLRLILLEQELRNAILNHRRWKARHRESKDMLLFAEAHLVEIEDEIERIKESL